MSKDTEEKNTTTEEHASDPPTKKWFWQRRPATTLLIIVGFIFIWHLFSDRVTPYTNNARVKAYVVPIIPEVSGYISEISIDKNDEVKAGDVLFQIQRKRFELAVENMEAALEAAGQSVDVKSATIEAAVANVAQAANEYKNVQAVTSRILALESSKAVSQMQVDQAKAQLSKAKAGLESAQANLKREKEALGKQGKDNPEMRSALAQLEEAQLNLIQTTVLAPSNGYITDSPISEGYYVSAGKPALTFISTDQVWIEADMSENNLGNVKPGQRVEILFDMYPGRIFHGEVAHLGWGASDGQTSAVGDLPTVAANKGWMRTPQRFPVIIKLTDYRFNEEGSHLRMNSQANVMVFTEETSVWNPLGKLWMRAASLLNYLY